MEQPDASSCSPTPVREGETVSISSRSDMTLSVLSSEDKNGFRTLTKFQVERAALTSSCEYFAASLHSNNANNSGDRDLELKDDTAGAMHVWLIYMQVAFEANWKAEESEEEHGQPAKKRKLDGGYMVNADCSTFGSLNKTAFDFITADDLGFFAHEAVYSTSIEGIWEIIATADKYLLNPSLLGTFFKLWFRANANLHSMGVGAARQLARQLALPCYFFDFAEGFAYVTKFSAYNHIGHITESRPQGFQWQHQDLEPPNFVGPMNHARGALKSSIQRWVWKKAEQVLKHGERECVCGYWPTAVGKYLAALVRTGAYPLETAFPKYSVEDMLALLDCFHHPFEGGCAFCAVDWTVQVNCAINLTANHFDGLCLDCMEASRPKHGYVDADYWQQLGSINGRWDRNCRVSHGESTWFISWGGQRCHRTQLLNNHRRRNVKNEDE